MERYSRHADLIGPDGQEALLDSKVLVIGAGGLGSPALYALAAAGIGRIGIVDDDVVELSNLNRQNLHSEQCIQRRKTDSAKETLARFHSQIDVLTYPRRFDAALAEELVPAYDIIVDCVDNYATRKLANRYAVLHKTPLIEAGIEGMSGFVQIVIPGRTACFNCFDFEEKEIYRQVLGASSGAIGNLQALECIKVLTGLWDGSYSYISLDFEHYALDSLLLEANEQCLCRNSSPLLATATSS